jgi:hypothetical protein
MTMLTPRVQIWKTCASYLIWVASVRSGRHALTALTYVAAAAFAVGVAGAVYTVALLIAAMRATP